MKPPIWDSCLPFMEDADKRKKLIGDALAETKKRLPEVYRICILGTYTVVISVAGAFVTSLYQLPSLLYFIVIFSAIPFGHRLILARHRRVFRAALRDVVAASCGTDNCLSCGYSLHGLSAIRTCPECGERISEIKAEYPQKQ